MPAVKTELPLVEEGHRHLSTADIAARLTDMELAMVGALRSMQMDLDPRMSIPSKTVLRQARRALKK